MSEGLVERITAYLSGGGLVNPELAIHDAVRGLLIDCRAALSGDYVRVPREPTEEMIYAGAYASGNGTYKVSNRRVRKIYKAMLAAAQGREG
jgi:hypothetical protein